MTSILHQDIFPQHLAIAPKNIVVRKLTLSASGAIAKHVLDNAVEVLGIALRFSSGGVVDAVAFATPDVVFYLSSRGTSAVPNKARTDLARVFDDPRCVLAGFGMARIALHLYRHFGVHVRGVDLSTLFARSTRTPQTPAEFASNKVGPDINRHRIHALWYHHEEHDVCLRAWLSAVLGQHSLSEIEYTPKVHTRNLQDADLRCLSELVMNVELLEAGRPTHMENEFEHVEMDEDGQLVIRNARFNNRVRPSKQTSVFLETACGHTVMGHAVRSEGKQTGIRVVGGNFRGEVERIRVVGREDYTNSELARDEFILLVLRGEIPSLTESPFIEMLWFPLKTAPQRPVRARAAIADTRVASATYMKLNPPQREVVDAMWSEDEPLVVAHGPPGTGKTTTIAAALERWDRDGEPTWVIAQSNVGVKNIARTLIKYAVDFKLLVSKEFYVEWHEHLYESIEERLIRSDELFSEHVDIERMLGGSTTILCTISTLSNPALDNCGVFYTAPVERLVVDEASQIDSFELMHLFHKFKHLEKVCMFGDPKQLPPYGQETAPQMKTIFDIKHLKPSAYFLNTQYRMPIPLGQFISEEVYNSKLKSVHKISEKSCVSFVDVRKGQEQSVGSSWRNIEEVHAVVNVVKNYYRSLDFSIITPYDGQRAAIVGRLKAEDLPWECVYNVDSFQGHEAAYMIVSTVRTTSSGFLKSLNRMNVMLTRCTAGMVLVTNRNFLSNFGRDTLLGKLAQRWGTRRDVWIDPPGLADRSASLPGALGRTEHVTSAWSMPNPPSEQSAMESSARVVPGAWPGAVTSASGRPRNGHATRFAQWSGPLASPSRQASEDVGGLLLSVRSSTLATGAWTTVGMNSQDQFPSLDGVASHKQPQAKGRWAAGSEACRL